MADALTRLSDRDLATRVAQDVLGMVPCDAWRPGNFGSAGGAVLFKECAHDDGKCWPTAELGHLAGRVGGPPKVVDRLDIFVESVVPAMRAKGFAFALHDATLAARSETPSWLAAFGTARGAAGNHATGIDANPARAGCLAALRALEHAT